MCPGCHGSGWLRDGCQQISLHILVNPHTPLSHTHPLPFLRHSSEVDSTSLPIRVNPDTFCCCCNLSPYPPSARIACCGDIYKQHTRTQRKGTPDDMPGQVSLQNSRRLSRKPSTGTFTPKFIKTQHSSASRDSRSTDSARDLAEFSGKRWVWLRDDKLAFVKGWVTEDNGSTLKVRCDNET